MISRRIRWCLIAFAVWIVSYASPTKTHDKFDYPDNGDFAERSEEFERYHFADELYTPTLDNFDYPQYEDLNEHLEECETYRFAGEPFLENVNALDGTDYAYYYVSPERSTGNSKIESYRAEVELWLKRVNAVLQSRAHERTKLMWQLQTNLTKEAENQLVKFQKRQSNISRIICSQHARIDTSILKPIQQRMMKRICNGIGLTPTNAREMIRVKAKLQSIYTKASVTVNNRTYHGESEVKQLMTSTSSNMSTLLKVWLDWRNAIGPQAKPLFTRLIEKENIGAKAAGYHDISQLWKEELEVDNLEDVADKLYAEIKPLYSQLYAYVRGRLSEWYQSEIIKINKPLPAHVLGNMWAQSWETLLPIFLANTSYGDAFKPLKTVPWSGVKEMARVSEDFFVSLGFPRLPPSFWTKSQFVQPTDGRKVVCHASATNFYKNNDVRLMMCGKRNEEDFYTLHHEMGHLYYFLTYSHQPYVFQTGANSAFHEAIGDTIVYGAMTAKHRRRVGLSRNSNDTNANSEIVRLLRLALMKLPLFPYSISLEKWRWRVMSGKIKPSNYNQAWWQLKLQYQGIVPSVPRSENDFDPAAKFHVINNVPYIRYYLSGILQVQFFDALCEATKQGPRFGLPLSECDIYGSKEAGNLLRRMMALGGSKPWYEALATITRGKMRKLSAKPLLEYYRPLYAWLIKENQHRNYTVQT